MSSVSSCRTRCGYPEHAVAIKHPDRKLLRRAKTVPYPTYCISTAAPPFDTVDLSRNVPTVFAVLSATDIWASLRRIPNANGGHGQASAAGHLYLPRHSDPHDRTYNPLLTLGWTTSAFGLFFLTTLPHISAVPATSASVPFG
jgi:hypothetical protein